MNDPAPVREIRQKNRRAGRTLKGQTTLRYNLEVGWGLSGLSRRLMQTCGTYIKHEEGWEDNDLSEMIE